MNINSLQSIMLAIVQAQSVEPIFEQIVGGVAESSDVALVRLWLTMKDNECKHCQAAGLGGGDKGVALHLMASAGQSRNGSKAYSHIHGRAHRIPLGQRKIGKIAETGEALLVPEAAPEQEWVVDPDWVRREGIQSFAGQPLICRGEVLGVLAVFSRAKFTTEEFQWLRTFADHAAVAIWNARAFDELHRLRANLELENEYLHEEIKEVLHFGEIIGESQNLKKVLQQVELVAETDATVLILGESGTGKELIARAIHERSTRRNRSLIKVNCGAIPKDLFESEFFGHVKGAFTGAVRDRPGRFELANGGVLFLDEVGEIPLALQVKLLRVLQEKQYERVGDARMRSLDVRIIAATNRNLEKDIAMGRFREDLYYRLSVFPIEVPPLRKRQMDIAPLARHFLMESCARLKIVPPKLTPQHIRQLEEYEWPGNVRELENVIERAAILSKASNRLMLDLPRIRARTRTHPLAIEDSTMLQETEPVILTKQELKRKEMDNILAALEACGGRVFGPAGAAKLLGMRPTTLASKLKTLGLRKKFIPPEQN